MKSARTDRVSTVSARVAAECAGGGLRRASRAISRYYESAFAPLDLTATQFSILVAVHLAAPVPLSRLAARLVLDRTSLYRAVKPLIRRGCLRVLPGRTGRERTATLTDSGRTLLADALPIWERLQDRFVSALGPKAWSTLAAGLDQVVPAVQALESGAPSDRSAPLRQQARHR